MTQEVHFVLRNGVRMPVLALGTFRLQSEVCREIVSYAIENRFYSHIDTASCYYNESVIGEVLQHCSIPRESLFITSKIAPRDMGYEETLNAAKEGLARLQLSYYDSLLIHWPAKSRIPVSKRDVHQQFRLDTWRALETLYEQNLCRAIGVSNFGISHIESLLPHCKIPPMINQVEFHPKCYQKELQDYCTTNNIQLVAYASLGNGKLTELPIVKSIAKTLNKTPAQILSRWGIQKNVGAMVKASSNTRIIENSEIFDFSLSGQQMLELDQLHSSERFCWNPSIVP
jgi:methylglyoxal/glyoxal reductase